MASKLDLNAHNYSIDEIESIFGLSKQYDESLLEVRSSKLAQNLLNDTNIDTHTKNNVLTFVQKIKSMLLEKLKNNRNPILKLTNTYTNVYNLDKSLHSSDLGVNNIIQKPITAYGQSSPSEFYQGTINPLNKRILRQNINIDTRFRDNYYSTLASNFHVDLPIRLTEVVSLQLSAIELPNTFHVISQVFNNNYFVLEIPEQDKLLITIPDGNYDNLSLQNCINNLLASSYGNYPEIKVFVDLSDHMVFSLIENATISTFSINFSTDKYGNEDSQTPLPLKLGWLMGFRSAYYKNNNTYISEGIVSLTGPKYIYLVVDDFNNNVLDGFYAAFTSSILNKNILARISLQESLFNYISKDNLNIITTPRQYFGPVDIQKLQIQLLDEYGRVLNLNNMDFSFCLTFQTIYDL
jgi:hypothetical protein